MKMNEELTQKLFNDFPSLYRDRSKTALQHGIECGDGWFDLIYKLSKDIEAVARNSGLQPDSPNWPLCRQIKEKFGSLYFVVFAIDGFAEMSEKISELRTMALNQSLHVCEQCGQPGKYPRPLC